MNSRLDLSSPLYYALDDFLDNNIYGPFEPAANYQTGFEATVAVIRVNDSVVSGETVPIPGEDFELQEH